ncbi:MAG: hypothetical protein INR62_02630 [Rhodospirillales bacterium]|nr:hypothetical protein [Acetobacter sp.]
MFLPVQTPFDTLASVLLDRTAAMFDLHLGMTLGEYQNRWLEIAGVAEDVTAQGRAESSRLHRLARDKGPGWRRWQAQAREVDGFVSGAFNAAEAWFIHASEPLLAAYEARFPDDEWFGIVLADDRACEAYGSLTLQQIIDLGDEQAFEPPGR